MAEHANSTSPTNIGAAASLSRRSLFESGAAAALAAGATALQAAPAGACAAVTAPMSTTPLQDINQRLCDLWKRHHAYDLEVIRLLFTEGADTARARMADTYYEIVDLQETVSSHQAISLEDVVIQANVAFSYLDVIAASDSEVRIEISKCLTLLASMIIFLTDNSGIGLDDLPGADMRHLCGLRGPGGSLAAPSEAGMERQIALGRA